MTELIDAPVEVTQQVSGQAPPLPLPPAPEFELPETLGYRIKNKLLGPPLHTDQLEHERLGNPTALAVFASDNLSSSAYATEEILRILLPVVGFAAFSLVVRSRLRCSAFSSS